MSSTVACNTVKAAWYKGKNKYFAIRQIWILVYLNFLLTLCFDEIFRFHTLPPYPFLPCLFVLVQAARIIAVISKFTFIPQVSTLSIYRVSPQKSIHTTIADSSIILVSTTCIIIQNVWVFFWGGAPYIICTFLNIKWVPLYKSFSWSITWITSLPI